MKFCNFIKRQSIIIVETCNCNLFSYTNLRRENGSFVTDRIIKLSTVTAKSTFQVFVDIGSLVVLEAIASELICFAIKSQRDVWGAKVQGTKRKCKAGIKACSCNSLILNP